MAAVVEFIEDAYLALFEQGVGDVERREAFGAVGGGGQHAVPGGGVGGCAAPGGTAGVFDGDALIGEQFAQELLHGVDVDPGCAEAGVDLGRGEVGWEDFAQGCDVGVPASATVGGVGLAVCGRF